MELRCTLLSMTKAVLGKRETLSPLKGPQADGDVMTQNQSTLHISPVNLTVTYHIPVSIHGYI